MRMKNRWVLSSLLFLMVGMMAACGGNEPADNLTGGIEGTVTVEGGDAAVDALVEFQERSSETRTGEEGEFSFEDVPTGTHNLRVSLQGYVTQRPEVEVAEGQTAQLEITLQEINEPPAIENVTIDPETMDPSGTASVEVVASDPNPADELSYTYEASGDFSVSAENGTTATVTAPDAFNAQGSVTVRVEDEEGRTARERLAVSTRNNTPPVINSVTASPSTVQPGGTTNVIVNASDAEGDSLEYNWTAPSDWSIDDSTAADIQVTAPDDYDASALLEVTVSDGNSTAERDFTATASINVSTVVNNGPSISSVTASPQTAERGGTVALDVEATDPNGDDLTYSWSAPSDWSLDDTTIQSPTLTAPTTPNTTAEIEVTVSDAEGLTATGSVVVSTEQNNAPMISSVVADNDSLSRGGSTDVTANATDPDEDSLTYAWSLSNSDWSYSGSGATISLTAPNTPSSSTLVTVTVTDSVGASTTSSTIVKTVPNDSPVVSSLYAANNPVARNGSTDVTADASDPNGDSLSYSWAVDDSSWSISGSGATVTLDAPDTPSDSVLVTVTVEDSLGATTTSTTQVSTAANDAPTITTVPNVPNSVSASRDTVWTYNASADDPDDTNLTWTVDSSPTGLDANVTSGGKLTVAPQREFANSDVDVMLHVSDGTDTTTQTFTLSVNGLNLQTDGNFSVADETVVAFDDFDDDGLSDMAGTAISDYRLSVIYGAEDYGFENTETWPSGARNFDDCSFDRAGDVDADGNLDIVTLCDEDNSGNDDITVATWIYDGAGFDKFTDGSSLNTGVAADVTDFVTAHLDSDGATEFVVTDTAESIHVFDNDGSGAVSVGQTVNPSAPSSSTGSWSIDRVFVKDVDGDPDLEVVIGESFNTSSGSTVQASILNFDGMGSLQSARTNSVTLDGGPDKIELADLTGDGAPEIITKAQDTTTSEWGVRSYVNDGAGAFMEVGNVTQSSLCNVTNNRGIDVGDIDDDGNTDVVVGNDCDGSVHVAFGDGTGAFDEILQLNQSTLGSDETENVFVGQTNSDGLDDIFAYDWGRTSIYF